MEDTLKTLTEILAGMGIGETEVSKEADFSKDLGLDSLDIAELIITIEQRFDIRIPDEEAESLTTVETAVDYIGHKTQEEHVRHGS